MPWEGLPPHRIVPSFVVFCGNDMSWTCQWNFRGSRGRGRKDVYSHIYVPEAEGNLNPYKPLGCLYSQFSLSRGDIVLQLLGFGTGWPGVCGVGS